MHWNALFKTRNVEPANAFKLYTIIGELKKKEKKTQELQLNLKVLTKLQN